MKENFSYFDLIFTQDILTELYQIEARAFQNFVEIEVPDGWRGDGFSIKISLIYDCLNKFTSTLISRS